MQSIGTLPVTLAYGGTLGDSFIVLCKLYSQHKKTGEHFRLIRYSMHSGMDKPIQELFSTIPFIEYIMPCTTCETPEEVHSSIENSGYGIVDTSWSENGIETFSIDYDDFDPFPLIETQEVEVKKGLQSIGIQLHCGSEGANFRGFSLNWLKKVRDALPTHRFYIYLFGTGASCYDNSEIDLICKKLDIINMIGKTEFQEFMGYIKKMNCFISLEGFSSFFTMSQKVPTVMYDQYFFGVDDAIHPKWKETNLVIRINSNYIAHKIRYLLITYFKRVNRYAPCNMEMLIKFMNTNLNERSKYGK